MSTVSVSNIKNASSAVNNAVTTSGGDLTNAAGVSFMSANKNLLYNGAMQVAQRGTSTASITTNGYYTADRWNANISSLGTWTQSVENDAPTGSGLRKSLKMLCTTADASPAAADFVYIQQALEGQDLQRIAKGTASAQQLTLSFWVKANVTGTYVAFLYDTDNTRSVSASYSISASATWEKKTITFPADTTGAFDNDSSASLTVYFALGVGSDRSSGTLATTWGTFTAANLAVGQTNVAAATNNYWQVTGTQLEIGPVATSFEFKSYGQELRECQRYYWLLASGSGGMLGAGGMIDATRMRLGVNFPTCMRTAPSLVCTTGTNYYEFYRNGAADLCDGLSISVATNIASALGSDTGISGTAGHAGFAYTNNASSFVAFTAEL